MNILLWIIFGALVGWVASLIMDTEESGDVVLDVITGVVGAFLGGMVMSLLGFAVVGGFDLSSFVVAILGAIVLVAIVRSVRSGGQSHVCPS
jgi:uncharacterized membrane protein YeaQ/YmgE (transglycosylase-associated protein family)